MPVNKSGILHGTLNRAIENASKIPDPPPKLPITADLMRYLAPRNSVLRNRLLLPPSQGCSRPQRLTHFGTPIFIDLLSVPVVIYTCKIYMILFDFELGGAGELD